MNKLTPTGIEYGELSWNFYPGCKHKQQGICPLPNCWAEGMSKRKREDFHTPHLIPERLLAPLSRKKPARILVNFMGDLMGDWVDPNHPLIMPNTVPHEDAEGKIHFPAVRLRTLVFDVMRKCPQHQFIFLTKNPDRYQLWGEWPDNAWLGATVWNQESFEAALDAFHITKIKAKHEWLSVEPLLSDITIGDPYDENTDYPPIMGIGIDWVVIGAQSRPDVMPKIEWVKEIVERCDEAGIKVWLKDNLRPLLDQTTEGLFRNAGGGLKLRQELPG